MTQTPDAPVISSRLWRRGELMAYDFDLDDLDTYLADPECLVWVDICRPDPDVFAKVSAELGIDRHSIEDALTPGERAKASRRTTHVFVTVYATAVTDPTDTGERLQLYRISAFVLKRGLITIRPNEGFDIDGVLKRWDDNADLMTFGVPALLHGLLDFVVDGHFECITLMDDAIESLEERVFSDTRAEENQQTYYQLRKDVVRLRRAVLPMREVVDALFRQGRSTAAAPPELTGFFEDLYDHVLRATEWTESLRDMLTSLFETSLALQDARLNTVMKKLAGWAAIIAVPTAITGWFGQNVPYWGFNTQAGVVLTTVLVVTCPLLLYIWFKRRDWI